MKTIEYAMRPRLQRERSVAASWTSSLLGVHVTVRPLSLDPAPSCPCPAPTPIALPITV